ncbi:MAG: FAD-dependent oxidoreductase [Alphaproteobacteria bacterium]|nr:FAD-dependent oxidoreductase [Alphaproteobacteria bacterium]
MQSCTYLIVGASHAGLAAADAIRMIDPASPLILASRDSHLPYSPTILPYVVSGRSKAERTALRSEAFFKEKSITFLRQAQLQSINAEKGLAHFDQGTSIRFDKLLLATGAAPSLPAIPGLGDVAFHVLRTMDDALGLKTAMKGARRALVLGAGLIGTHAAENMAEAGMTVSIVEPQMQLLPGYFDSQASSLIEKAFEGHGIDLKFGRSVASLKPGVAVLDDGQDVPFDLLLIATGVRPALSYLDGSGIRIDRGILVDERQRTNLPAVWAAGDCAQVRLFQSEGTGVAGILPMAVEQGRIAGQGMVDDEGQKPFPGAVSLNTYSFFGQQAISVGAGISGADSPGTETVLRFDEGAKTYLRLVLKEDRLVGAASVNHPLDPGILWQLILRQTDLSDVKERFLADPKTTGRLLMSRLWR